MRSLARDGRLRSGMERQQQRGRQPEPAERSIQLDRGFLCYSRTCQSIPSRRASTLRVASSPYSRRAAPPPVSGLVAGEPRHKWRIQQYPGDLDPRQHVQIRLRQLLLQAAAPSPRHAALVAEKPPRWWQSAIYHISIH